MRQTFFWHTGCVHCIEQGWDGNEKCARLCARAKPGEFFFFFFFKNLLKTKMLKSSRSVSVRLSID